MKRITVLDIVMSNKQLRVLESGVSYLEGWEDVRGCASELFCNPCPLT